MTKNNLNDHLSFYLENEISPVRQDISNLSKHLERRSSLYRYLGLPNEYFKGKNILEVGPASGHNSLYVASCKPDKFDLLEPNPVAVKEIDELYKNFNIPHTIPRIISKPLQEFEKFDNYDLVICEAWLGISHIERELMKKLCSFVKSNGILITTLASPVGYFFNMIRRLISQKFLFDSDNLDQKTKKLLSAFSPHLKTLKDMTCPHIDWVQDSLINPGFLDMHPSPSMFINDIGLDFSIYNTYPNFSSDWRWYKSLYGENKNFNNISNDSYQKNIHNFLDYRFVFEERSPKQNNELEQLCFNLRNFVVMVEDIDNNSISQAVDIIIKVKENIDSLKSPLVKCIDEVLSLIKTDKIDIDSIAKMKYFHECFGRELLYVSTIRDN